MRPDFRWESYRRLFWIEDGVDNRSNVNWFFKWHDCGHWSRRCASLAVSPVLPAPIIHLFPSFLEFAVMHFLIGWRTVDLGRRTEKIVHSLFMCIWNLNIINNESTRLPNRSSNLATLQWRPKRNLNSRAAILPWWSVTFFYPVMKGASGGRAPGRSLFTSGPPRAWGGRAPEAPSFHIGANTCRRR